MRIPIIIPIKGRGLINHECGLGFRTLPRLKVHGCRVQDLGLNS